LTSPARWKSRLITFLPEEAQSPIPIQNIYYLLCYAWNRLEERDVIDVQSLNSAKLVDLFAKVLVGGTRHLIRRGFDRGYLAFAEDTGRIRGKISFASSLKRNLFSQARVHCVYDELDYNVLHNRILKTTISRLVFAQGLDLELKEGLGEVLRRLRDIEPLPLTSQIFRRVQLHRNNHYYGFLLNVCELIYDHLLVDERTGKSRFRDFLRDENRMAALFEKFVRNFYELEQDVFDVRSPKIKWQATSEDATAMRYLPEMRTDVCLISPHRKIILDCKYYRETLQKHHQKASLKSENLYQIFAYVKNKEIDPGWEVCEGMLLYPVVDQTLKLTFEIQGHLCHVSTINLNQDWQYIEKDMLNIIGI
jgi:5-methylcytosine-specific restriction enzyme subunit McrC